MIGKPDVYEFRLGMNKIATIAIYGGDGTADDFSRIKEWLDLTERMMFGDDQRKDTTP